MKLLSRVRLLATPWTAAHQAPPSMGFSRQEYWSGVPLPSPERMLGEEMGMWDKNDDGKFMAMIRAEIYWFFFLTVFQDFISFPW